MANIDTWLTADKDRPRLETGPTLYRRQFSLTAGNSADVIRLVNLYPYQIVKGAVVVVSGTLGASCTLQLRRDTTTLSAATTAAAANFISQNALDEPSTDGDDNLNLVIAGANVGATATVTVEAQLWFTAD